MQNIHLIIIYVITLIKRILLTTYTLKTYVKESTNQYLRAKNILHIISHAHLFFIYVFVLTVRESCTSNEYVHKINKIKKQSLSLTQILYIFIYS